MIKKVWLSPAQIKMSQDPEFINLMRQLFYVKQEGSFRILPDNKAPVVKPIVSTREYMD